MIALMVLTGLDARDVYDSLPVDVIEWTELLEAEEERRRDPRMLVNEKERMLVVG